MGHLEILSLVSLLLCLTSSGVICDQELALPLSSDLKLIYWNGMEDCVRKVSSMLSNITAFCAGDNSDVDPRVISCQDITSNLMKLLQSEQSQSRNCRLQLNAAKSMLDTFLKHISEFKEAIRGMLGVAIRYQGNRTSLNDVLNRNHQQLLRSVEEMLQDVHKWKHGDMNISNWDVSFRHIGDCEVSLKTCNEGLMAKLSELAYCKSYLNENASLPDIRTLRIDLNATTQKLKHCESDKQRLQTRLQEELMEKRQWNQSSTYFIERYNKCDNALRKEQDKNNKLRSELENVTQQLETCINSMNSEKTKGHKCHSVMTKLQEHIFSQNGLLGTKFSSVQTTEESSEEDFESLQQELQRLLSRLQNLTSQVKLKTDELRMCEKDKKSLTVSLMDCKDETKNLENKKTESEEKFQNLEKDLSSCNRETKQLQITYTSLETQFNSTNTQLKLTTIQKEELERQHKASQEKVNDLQQQLKGKEKNIKDLENDKDKLNDKIMTINKDFNKCVEEKKETLEELQLKDESLKSYIEQLNQVKEQYLNYTTQCQIDINQTLETSQQHQQILTQELNSIKKENTNLKTEIHSLEILKDKLTKEVDTLKIEVTSVTKASQNCVQEKDNLTKTLALKESYIEDLEREKANIHLTSKLTYIRLNTKQNELELKFRQLEDLLKNNGNELKMLQEYGVILIMVANKNTQLLRFLKQTINSKGEELTEPTDGRLQELLMKLLKSLEEHHSILYEQLLQMKPHMDKVVPLRVRREVQRGRTLTDALLDSAKEGNLTATDILLDVGAGINVQDKKGLTALHWAARHGHADVAELLLSRGADPHVHARAMGNKTPLHLAAEYGHPEVVEVLLDFGSSTEARALDYATPLLYAANRGHDQVVSILLQRGADVHSTNAYNQSALDLATKFPNVRRVIETYIYGS